MKYIIAHDLGTSGNKATLFREDGQMVTSETFAYGCHYFNANWAEQDPEDWWRAICETSRNLIAKANIDASEIAAISFSGQMMGCLCVDRAGNPLRPSIIWADQRAQKQAEAINEQISLYDFYHIAGHRNAASTEFCRTHVGADNEPEVYARTYKTLNAKDFIVLRLTGKFYTEPVGRDIEQLHRPQHAAMVGREIVKASGIDGEMLPEIVPSTFVAGGVTRWAAEQTGTEGRHAGGHGRRRRPVLQRGRRLGSARADIQLHRHERVDRHDERKAALRRADAHVHVGAHRPRPLFADGHMRVGRQQL